MAAPKLIIIGLDSVSPDLAFGQFQRQMPHLSALREAGMSGPLKSTDPPITIPAWISMTTGNTPGQLGIYGFQQFDAERKTRITCSNDISVPRIWDLAATAGQKSVVVSVPATFPASSLSNVFMTSGFLTPSLRGRWASRPSMARDIESRFGEYIIDVSDFRRGDVTRIADDCMALTRQHFEIFRYLISKESPDFAMMVDMGPDRIHHAALRYISRAHPLFENDSLGKTYYQLLDAEIGKTLALAGPDTVVMVVSDHGIQPLLGSFCVNELLYRNGDLVLAQPYPEVPTLLHTLQVDWSKTTAYAKGGYVGRVWLNQHGRDACGVVPATARMTQLERLKNSLSTVEMIEGEESRCVLESEVFTPEELYGACRPVPPDLTLYVENLNYRAAGTLGHRRLSIPCNDTGADDANHDMYGILAMNRKCAKHGADYQIYDVFATACRILDIRPPKGTLGGALL